MPYLVIGFASFPMLVPEINKESLDHWISFLITPTWIYLSSHNNPKLELWLTSTENIPLITGKQKVRWEPEKLFSMQGVSISVQWQSDIWNTEGSNNLKHFGFVYFCVGQCRRGWGIFLDHGENVIFQNNKSVSILNFESRLNPIKLSCL